MDAEQMHLVMLFAVGLSKVKKAHDDGEGVDLTPDDVRGLMWGIQSMRPRDAVATDAEQGGAS